MPHPENTTSDELRKSDGGGWIKIHQSFKRWRWRHKPEMVSLWLELLLRANWHDSEFEYHDVQRGQAVVGLKSLSRDTGLSIRTIRTCLSRLKSTGEVTIKTTSKFSIITIVKYSEYQDNDRAERQAKRQANRHATDTQPTNDRHATDNIQEYKNIRIEEDKTKEEEVSPLPSSKPPKPIKVPKTKKALPDLVWPESLKTDNCLAAFERWRAHRRGCAAPMSRLHEQALLDGWAHGPDEFCATIENSIKGGYKKLVRPSEEWGTPGARSAARGKITTVQRNKELLRKLSEEESRNGKQAIGFNQVSDLPVLRVRQGDHAGSGGVLGGSTGGGGVVAGVGGSKTPA